MQQRDPPTKTTVPCPRCGATCPPGYSYCGECSWPVLEPYPLSTESFNRRYADCLATDPAIRITFIEKMKKKD